MTFYSIMLTLTCCFPVCLFHKPTQCPSPWEWRLRGIGYCKSSKEYSCLFNEITNDYEESCRFRAFKLKVGEHFIIRHNPVGVPCRNDDRYQPFKLKLLQTDCTVVRSKCKEPGQVIFHRGNESKDTTCRCNFQEGWAFVSKPKTSCYCVPSQDDCTCYLKKCPSGYILTPDYQCVRQTQLSYLPFSCPDMNPQIRNNSHGYTFTKINYIVDESISGLSHSLILVGPTTFIIMCIVYIVLAGFLFVLEKLPSVSYIEISHPKNHMFIPGNGRLILTWTKPQIKQVYIHQYKVTYTFNDWVKPVMVMWVDGKESSCEIPDIRPMKTYRFIITSCLKNNVEGKSSDEFLYISQSPNRPQTLHAVGIDCGIKLAWTTPVPSELGVDEYHIEVSFDGKNVKNTIKDISSDTREYSFENVKENITYWFRIYSVYKAEKSYATEDSYFTGLSHRVTLPIDANVDVQAMSDVNSRTYEHYTQAVETAVHDEFQQLNGTQTASNITLWTGSLFASFILVSKEWYDQISLQTVMNNAINKGTFGSLKVSRDGYDIIALNYPVPPRHVSIEKQGRHVQLSWTEPAKTFYKTNNFMVQYKTDNWEEWTNTIVPHDEHQFSINVDNDYEDFTCSTTLYVKIYTLIKSSIQSLPSQTVSVELPEIKTFPDKIEYDRAQVRLEKGSRKFTLTRQFRVNASPDIENVKLLRSGLIVLCERYTQRLITMTIIEEQTQYLPLTGYPNSLAVIDDWNVAVSLKLPDNHFSIVIVDLQHLKQVRHLSIPHRKNDQSCCPITCANHELYAQFSSGEIVVMNTLGHIRTKIYLSDTFLNFSVLTYDEKNDRIGGMSLDGEYLICVDKHGKCKTIYTFSKDDFLQPQIAFDNDGQLCVLKSYRHTSNYQFDSLCLDGKSCRKLFSSKIDTNFKEYELHAIFDIQNSMKTIVIMKSNIGHMYTWHMTETNT